jgi:CheY-like chemotaxis protein
MAVGTRTPRRTRPVALIVEDMPKTLDTRIQIFNSKGFSAIGARSKAEALRELRSAPAIDLVVTDIGLNPENPEKDSGVELLEEVRWRRKDLPVVGYSAQDVDSHVAAAFDDFLPKERARELLRKAEEWLELALNYRETRIGTARSMLKGLQEKYRITDSDIEIFRDFLPATQDPPRAETDDSFATADEQLRTAGYRLRIIEANTTVPESGVPVAVPVAVWLRQVPGAIIAELYGHPSIVYGEGEFEVEDLSTLTDADRIEQLHRAENISIGQVLDLMYGFHQDLTEKANASNGGEVQLTEEMRALRSFLHKVFG